MRTDSLYQALDVKQAAEVPAKHSMSQMQSCIRSAKQTALKLQSLPCTQRYALNMHTQDMTTETSKCAKQQAI